MALLRFVGWSYVVVACLFTAAVLAVGGHITVRVLIDGWRNERRATAAGARPRPEHEPARTEGMR